jgi:hypothetical protein
MQTSCTCTEWSFACKLLRSPTLEGGGLNLFVCSKVLQTVGQVHTWVAVTIDKGAESKQNDQ